MLDVAPVTCWDHSPNIAAFTSHIYSNFFALLFLYFLKFFFFMLLLLFRISTSVTLDLFSLFSSTTQPFCLYLEFPQDISSSLLNLLLMCFSSLPLDLELLVLISCHVSYCSSITFPLFFFFFFTTSEVVMGS